MNKQKSINAVSAVAYYKGGLVHRATLNTTCVKYFLWKAESNVMILPIYHSFQGKECGTDLV